MSGFTIGGSGLGIGPDISAILRKATMASTTGVIGSIHNILSINGEDDTMVDVDGRSAQIIDTTTTPGNPVCKEISWSPQTISITNIATSQFTNLYVNDSGTILQETTRITAEDRRTKVFIGGCVHIAGTVVEGVQNFGIRASGNGAALLDLMDAVGNINVSGNVYVPNGANLKMNRSAGVVSGREIDSSDTLSPHTLDTDLIEDIPIYIYLHRNGSGGWIATPQTEIQTDKIDDGTGTLVTLGNNKFSVQPLLFDPLTGLTAIYYGQIDYMTIEDAIAGSSQDTVEKNPNLVTTVLRGWLALREDTIELNDGAFASFREKTSE